MSWIYLTLAIAFEVTGTALLKLSNGNSNIKTFIGLLVSYGLSLFFLSVSLKKIEVSVAYAVWSGLGITAIVAIGIFFFKEPVNLQKLIFIAMILIGSIGLNCYRA